MTEGSYSFVWGAVAVVIGTAVLLAIPYLALIALLFALIALLVAGGRFLWTNLTGLFARGRFAHRRWRAE